MARQASAHDAPIGQTLWRAIIVQAVVPMAAGAVGIKTGRTPSAC